jgi:hypothetical protein
LNKELCIRCGKPTLYDINTPITIRRYYIEGSGQLCSHCFYELYSVPGSLQSNLGVDNITTAGEKVLESDIPNKQ